jgi:hypothetical protein
MKPLPGRESCQKGTPQVSDTVSDTEPEDEA